MKKDKHCKYSVGGYCTISMPITCNGYSFDCGIKELQQLKDEKQKLEIKLKNKTRSFVEEKRLKELVQKRWEEDIKPFQDTYFKDLSYEVIAELAKKSIRLTKENSEQRDIILAGAYSDEWKKRFIKLEIEYKKLETENRR
jgi:wyosine [tRNA(Phe)-imidazoG37] synthetase (radical SAM superfamily)